MRKSSSAIIESVIVCVAGFFFAASSCAAGRPTGQIGSADLDQIFHLVHLVDCRSRLEYDHLRMKNAVHVPVGTMVREDLVRLQAKDPDRPIVFYCNGRTCMKSYIASKKCMEAKIKNVSAYDAGMFEWAQAYPYQAELFGVSPVNKSDIIPSAQFKSRLIPPEKFGSSIFSNASKNVVLDVRDKYQRGAAGFFPGKESWISLDKEKQLKEFIYKAKSENKTLYIYDEVGKQVRWLQYALESAEMKNYYFMKKGAKAFYANMMKDMGISTVNLK